MKRATYSLFFVLIGLAPAISACSAGRECDPNAVLPSSVDDIQDLGAVEFCSGGVDLIGRLELPAGEAPYPLLVVVHGAGEAATRSSYDFVVAEFLRAGYAVFVPDKRGVGDSGGRVPDVGGRRTAGAVDLLIGDTVAAVELLTGLAEIDRARVGLVGASQAGWIIPEAANRSGEVDFTVIVNGPTYPVFQNLVWEDLGSENERANAWWLLQPMSDAERMALSSEFLAYDGAAGYDPYDALKALSVPGIWLWGDLDTRVPARESAALLQNLIDAEGKPFTIYYDDVSGHNWSPQKTVAILDWLEEL